MALQWKRQYFEPQRKYIYKLITELQYLQHYTLQKFGSDLLITFVQFLNVESCQTFSFTSIIFFKTAILPRRKKVTDN